MTNTSEYNIKQIPNGAWKQNCYLIYRDNELLIIDPGSEEASIIEVVNSTDAKPIAILNTHAHYDHIGAVLPLMEHYNIPFYLHSADKKLLKRANMYSSLFGGNGPINIPEDFIDILEQPSTFKIGKFDVECLATPGHTKGGCCFLIQKHLFSGDTLFAKNIGRVDLPGGNIEILKKSLKLLSTVDKETHVYPGHGETCTMSYIYEHNREFRDAI